MAPPGEPPDAEDGGLAASAVPSCPPDGIDAPSKAMRAWGAEPGTGEGLRSRRPPKVRQERDMLWQREPDRVLKYRPEHLHYYGWMPAFVPGNIKATVFSNVYLHVQAAALLAWVAVLHVTGLSVPKADLASFLRLFGTPYAGAIFNMAMLITFVLGLFVSLVVNRWSTIKQAYARLIGSTMDLVMLVSTVVRDPGDPREPRCLRARVEVTRLLNLGHILAISRADALDRDFKPARAVGHLAKVLGASLRHGATAPPRDAFWSKKPRNIDLEDLEEEGLVNRDEWEILEGGWTEGLAKHQVVYFWVQAVLLRCKGAGWVASEGQMLPLMLAKLNAVVEAASQMFNTIGSQMPYPYVALVSFVVHAYLFVTATWYGLFLHVGFPTEENFVGAFGGREVALHKGRAEVSDSYWTAAWCYFFVALANVMFQGLLDMHALMDNPFGAHVAKFPLRAQATRLLNATRTMLSQSDAMPAAFGDIFSDMLDGDDGGVLEFKRSIEAAAGRPSARRTGSLSANFMNPPSMGGGMTFSEVHAWASPRVSQEGSGSANGIAVQVMPEANSSTQSGS
ncbi:unnamed protein product [Ostreobium quekettii]|uniref:Uncharacterized protein n=1 Tax=Ostreobium quekettii TaxID=121088 RepID=A0A8S1IZW5_9CHLO|nr:unnamed protein product [Ostreobium quekettii]